MQIVKSFWQDFIAEPNYEYAMNAVHSTLAVILVLILAFSLHFSNPFWAMVCIPMVVSPYSARGLSMGLYLVFGTTIGVWIAVALSPWVNGDIVFLSVVNFLIMLIGFYISETGHYKYAVVLATANAVLFLSQSQIRPEIINDAILRSMEFSLSIFAAIFVSLTFFPVSFSKKFDAHYSKFLNEFLRCYQESFFLKSNKREDMENVSSRTLQLYYNRLENLWQEYNNESFLSKNYSPQLQKKVACAHHLLTIYQTYIHAFFHMKEFEWLDFYRDKLFSINNLLSKAITELKEKGQVNIEMLSELKEKLNIFEKNIFDDFSNIPNKQLSKNDYHHVYSWVDHQNLLLNSLVDSDEVIVQKPPVTITSKFLKLLDWKLDVKLLRHSIKLSLAITIALLIWLYLQFPGGSQGIVSIIVIGYTVFSSGTLNRGLERLLGCFAGCVVAIFFLNFFYVDIYSLLYGIAVVTALFTFFMYKIPYLYGVLFQSLIVFYLMVVTRVPAISLVAGLERFSGIVLGILIMIIINHVLWPLYPRETLKKNITELKEKMNQLFEILKNLIKKADTQSVLTKTEIQALGELRDYISSTQAILTSGEFSLKKDRILVDEANFYLKRARRLLPHFQFIFFYLNFPLLYKGAQKLKINVDVLLRSFDQTQTSPPNFLVQNYLDKLFEAINKHEITFEEAKQLNRFYKKLDLMTLVFSDSPEPHHKH